MCLKECAVLGHTIASEVGVFNEEGKKFLELDDMVSIFVKLLQQGNKEPPVAANLQLRQHILELFHAEGAILIRVELHIQLS